MAPPRQSDDGGREASATEDVQNPPFEYTIPPVTRPKPVFPKDERELQPLPQSNPDGSYNVVTDTGWSAMARNMREVDEKMVKSCNEDLDSILVFAGLFSAVMTAFLVESYHNLSPDPTNMMIMLLQQVASQTRSYSLNNGFLSSTASPLPPPTLPDFQPTANAIRVNVLWFASLTLSLISTSFSILVKQWLREYLAGSYISPQARLRIRHFRFPGLDYWKVFEIAAMIPLLLQLSLALFFIGLCFFTAGIHDSVAHTTLPLVAGWGFLFIAVSLAPVLSPRCPYKTPLLRSALIVVRKRIYRTFLWAKRPQAPVIDMPLSTSVPNKWSFMNVLKYDEETVTKDGSHDIEILISVDSVQTDDHELPIMLEAARQTMPGPAESVVFIRKIIGHRIQQDIPDTASASTNYLDLTRLPKRTITLIWLRTNNLLKEEIMRQLDNNPQSKPDINWLPWMKDCVHIFLSRTSTQLPPVVDETLSLLTSAKPRCATLFEAIVSRTPNPDTLPHVLERLRGALSRQRESLLDTLKIIVEAYFCADHGTHSVPSCRFLSSLENHPQVTPTHLQSLVSIVVSASLEQFDFRPGVTFGPWQNDRLAFILSLPKHHLYHDDTMKFVKFLLLRYSANIHCKQASGLYWRPSYRSYAQELFIEAIVSSELHESEEIMRRVIVQLDKQWNQSKESEDPPWRRSSRLDPLETYYMVLRALQNATEEKGKASLEPLWTLVRDDLWPSVENGMEIVAARIGLYEGHPESARSCLELIDTFDIPSTLDLEDNDAFVAWADNFDDKASLVPDACIKMLGRFLPGINDVKSYRLRRTRRMDAQRAPSLTEARRAGKQRARAGQDLLQSQGESSNASRHAHPTLESEDDTECSRATRRGPSGTIDSAVLDTEVHWYKIDKLHRVLHE